MRRLVAARAEVAGLGGSCTSKGLIRLLAGTIMNIYKGLQTFINPSSFSL